MDTQSLIEYGGLLVVFLAVYVQTGLFFCFFIPSGAFMFAAGAMAASGGLNDNFFYVGSVLVLAAILGNLTGYIFGFKAGSHLCNRPDSRFFKQEYITKAERFYQKFGGKALSLGLFLPVIRTFSPIVSGIIRLNFSRFMLNIIIGSVGWVYSFLLAGYLIGSRPLLRPYIKYFIVGIIVIVSIPVVMRIAKELKVKSLD